MANPNKYDVAFFQMVKQRGEELFPLDPPFGWHAVNGGAGIVYATEEDRANDSHTWWLSWVRKNYNTDIPDIPDILTQ